MEPKPTAEVITDESALDAELAESLNAIKNAGKEPEPAKAEVKPEAKAEEPKKEPEADKPKEEEAGNPPAGEDTYEFRLPNKGSKPDKKGKFESDESYEKRIELMDLIAKRKLSKDPSKREELSKQIDSTRNQMMNLGGKDKINNLNKVEGDLKKEDEDPVLKADKERLKQLGGATKEDIEQIIQNEAKKREVASTLEKFVERHPELKDEDAREVFFDFVDSNYNWQNKGGKELMTTLELARENMFRPSESIQERVLKGADVQNKVNAMQFPGGAMTKASVSPEMQRSIDELKSTGMSEEKARELLSD
jgi:hypothetical protein